MCQFSCNSHPSFASVSEVVDYVMSYSYRQEYLLLR
ncbi:hypothetical protein A2U01_0070781, partial [Trifolium medium]|nr:hypothetical protein [Trifolium medium]